MFSLKGTNFLKFYIFAFCMAGPYSLIEGIWKKR